MNKTSILLLAITAMALSASAQNRGRLPLTSMTTDTITAPIRSGSADIIGQGRMNKGLVINSLDAISGQAAGVAVTTGENRMAMINSIRVRGTTS